MRLLHPEPPVHSCGQTRARGSCATSDRRAVGCSERCCASARAKADLRRSGASAPADGVQAGGDTPTALVRGQARPLDPCCVLECPGDDGDGSLSKNDLYKFWITVRDAAGIVADARLHDLRHTHVSHAVMNSENLNVAGRLLGHRRASGPQPVVARGGLTGAATAKAA